MITGGSGFIGSNFIVGLLNSEPDITIFNVDSLTYAGNPANLQAIADDSRYCFFQERTGTTILYTTALTQTRFNIYNI